MMALILLESLLEHLQSSYSVSGAILTGQRGLNYGDVCFMPPCCMFLMQHIPFPYFPNMVQDRTFQPAKYKWKDISETTAILLVIDAELTQIGYVHIGLVVCNDDSQVYEPKSIPDYIQYIKDDMKYAKQKQEAVGSMLKVCFTACLS